MHLKIRTLLALLLAALLAVGAVAEGQLASDLSGDLTGDYSGEWQDDGYVDDGSMAPQEPVSIFDADLLIGYVAKSGATLNPFYCNEQDLVNLNQLVFESLVELDENQKPSPMLADNWTHDGMLWTFTLRSGIYFHNGAELTAYDVEATYDRFIEAGSVNPYFSRLNQFIEDMQAMDDRTLAVKSRYTGYMTLYAMTFPVMHASTLDDDMPRGTGPFWYVSYEIDNAVRIEANALWWKQQPTIGSITFRRYEEIGDAIEGLQTRQVEMLSTQSSTAALCRKLANLTSMDYGTATFEMMVPNISSESVMSDVNVRQAVMYAIDRSVLASNAYLDMAIQSEVPVLPGTWLYESQSAQYYYSPERALQLLYDSGWKDLTGDTMLNKLNGIKIEQLEVNIITYNEDTTSIRENAVNLIAGYLNAVGIKTNVEVLSKSQMTERLKNRSFDLALIGVNLSEIPVLQPLLGTGGSLNFNRYSNSTMDDLIAQTSTATDETSLKQIYSEIQLMLVDRLPIMGLLFRTGTVLSTRSLGGLNGIRAMDTFRGLEYLAD